METKYRKTETTVSFINYHIVFCPRYRRKIFSIPGVEDRFKELTRQECAKHGNVMKIMCICLSAHIRSSVFLTL